MTVGRLTRVWHPSPAWQQFLSSPTALLGLGILGGAILLALFGTYLTPYTVSQDVGVAFAPPSLAHPMGTDHLARDQFTRFIAGTRVSLLVGFSAATLATGIGLLVGAAAGFLGGTPTRCLCGSWTSCSRSRCWCWAWHSRPSSVRRCSTSCSSSRCSRGPRPRAWCAARSLSIRDREYVRAAVATGSSSWWIVFREIMPNVVPVIIVAWSFEVGSAIIVEAGLSFLGLGDLQAGSWGIMLFDAQRFLRDAWWMAVFPGLGIALAVLAANLIGEALNDAFDPRLQGR